ncbi:hypothetical protein LQ564_18095 [Massilia sp. G4R7]|uniref:Transmembrane protein n=1 Tax=Massilia phyllostachyos TaxID=2898585 RepID=A0ABS8Q9K5_9BURK|nr:hypothetical protein [Massilia phyllostachyos]MCD2518223.1 hypothetical protein [Massilia phyllostachyos]
MLFLRLVCLLAGFLVLLAPPAMLYPTGASAKELIPAAGMLAALLLAAAGFFFVALTGHRIRRSPVLQRLCALLMAAPFLAGAAALWNAATPTALWMSGLLLGFTLIVTAILAYPLLQGPSPRRLRARETHQRRHHPLEPQLGSELNYLPLSHHHQASSN